MIIAITFSLITAITLALLFEIIFGIIEDHQQLKTSKVNFAKVYYVVIAFVWTMNSNALWMTQLPGLMFVALSHCDLCLQPSLKITWREIVKNIIPAAKDALRRICA